MKKSILAILATVSIGATGLEAGNAHAAENTNQNYNSRLLKHHLAIAQMQVVSQQAKYIKNS